MNTHGQYFLIVFAIVSAAAAAVVVIAVVIISVLLVVVVVARIAFVAHVPLLMPLLSPSVLKATRPPPSLSNTQLLSGSVQFNVSRWS